MKTSIEHSQFMLYRCPDNLKWRCSHAVNLSSQNVFEHMILVIMIEILSWRKWKQLCGLWFSLLICLPNVLQAFRSISQHVNHHFICLPLVYNLSILNHRILHCSLCWIKPSFSWFHFFQVSLLPCSHRNHDNIQAYVRPLEHVHYIW
jgi:hypothetical protein